MRKKSDTRYLRFPVLLKPREKAALDAKARELGISAAELLRRRGLPDGVTAGQ